MKDASAAPKSHTAIRAMPAGFFQDDLPVIEDSEVIQSIASPGSSPSEHASFHAGMRRQRPTQLHGPFPARVHHGKPVFKSRAVEDRHTMGGMLIPLRWSCSRVLRTHRSAAADWQPHRSMRMLEITPDEDPVGVDGQRGQSHPRLTTELREHATNVNRATSTHVQGFDRMVGTRIPGLVGSAGSRTGESGQPVSLLSTDVGEPTTDIDATGSVHRQRFRLLVR